MFDLVGILGSWLICKNKDIDQIALPIRVIDRTIPTNLLKVFLAKVGFLLSWIIKNLTASLLHSICGNVNAWASNLVLRLSFFMLNSAETEIYPAHKC